MPPLRCRQAYSAESRQARRVAVLSVSVAILAIASNVSAFAAEGQHFRAVFPSAVTAGEPLRVEVDVQSIPPSTKLLLQAREDHVWLTVGEATVRHARMVALAATSPDTSGSLSIRVEAIRGRSRLWASAAARTLIRPLTSRARHMPRIGMPVPPP
jgi:hypothetical protein